MNFIQVIQMKATSPKYNEQQALSWFYSLFGRKIGQSSDTGFVSFDTFVEAYYDALESVKHI